MVTPLLAPLPHLQGPSLTSHMQIGSYTGPLDMSTGLGLLLEMRPRYLGVQMDALVNRGLSTLAAIERQKNATKIYPLLALFETNDALDGELENPKRPRWKQIYPNRGGEVGGCASNQQRRPINLQAPRQLRSHLLHCASTTRRDNSHRPSRTATSNCVYERRLHPPSPASDERAPTPSAAPPPGPGRTPTAVMTIYSFYIFDRHSPPSPP